MVQPDLLLGHDAASWQAAWARDPGAMMTEVVARHRRAIYSRAREVCGEDRAADVAQEVLLRFWQHPERYDPTRSSLSSYLQMVTRSVAVDLVRQDARRRYRDERSGRAELSLSPDPADALDPITLRRLADALSALDARHRDAVVSSFIDRIVHREIAQREGLPEGTVKSRIRAGLTNLRGQLNDLDGRTPS